MTNKDNISDFDYDKDFNEAFNNVNEQPIIEEQVALDPVIERRSIFSVDDSNNITPTENGIIDNDTVIQMITGNNSVDLEEQKAQQNFPMAVLSGIIASIICIIIWATITVITEYQITYMAIGVGVIVGFTIQKFGKGLTPIYGLLGAGLALIACFCGNIVSYTCFIANMSENYSYINALSDLDWDVSSNIALDTFQPIDLLYYGLAIYTGYVFSIKQPK